MIQNIALSMSMCLDIYVIRIFELIHVYRSSPITPLKTSWLPQERLRNDVSHLSPFGMCNSQSMVDLELFHWRIEHRSTMATMASTRTYNHNCYIVTFQRQSITPGGTVRRHSTNQSLILRPSATIMRAIELRVQHLALRPQVLDPNVLHTTMKMSNKMISWRSGRDKKNWRLSNGDKVGSGQVMKAHSVSLWTV